MSKSRRLGNSSELNVAEHTATQSDHSGGAHDDDTVELRGDEAPMDSEECVSVGGGSDGDTDAEASTAGVDDETAQFKPPHPVISDGSEISEYEYSDVDSELDDEKLDLRYEIDGEDVVEEDVMQFVADMPNFLVDEELLSQGKSVEEVLRGGRADAKKCGYDSDGGCDLTSSDLESSEFTRS